MQVFMAMRGSECWVSAVGLAHERYVDEFAAEADSDPDSFIVASASHDLDRDETDQIVACVGISYGDGVPFFSERYLGCPVEEAIAEATGETCLREEVVEVGTLASTAPAAGVSIMRLTPLVVWALQRRFVVCTATAQLRGLFDRLGYQYTELATASPQALDEKDRARWGRYYAHQPVTCVLRIEDLLLAEMGPTRARPTVDGIRLSILHNEKEAGRAVA